MKCFFYITYVILSFGTANKHRAISLPRHSPQRRGWTLPEFRLVAMFVTCSATSGSTAARAFSPRGPQPCVRRAEPTTVPHRKKPARRPLPRPIPFSSHPPSPAPETPAPKMQFASVGQARASDPGPRPSSRDLPLLRLRVAEAPQAPASQAASCCHRGGGGLGLGPPA